MSDESKIHRAGDVQLTGVTIIGGSGVILDITPQVMSIELIENIFEPFTTGIITVTDAIELTNILPIVGREIVTVAFKTPQLGDEYSYERTFCVYNCTDKIKVNERASMYQLRIISQEAFIDKAMRVSRTFRGSPDEIVRELVFEHGLTSPKRFVAEQTSNEITFISNWWHPTKCIDYVCRRALNKNDSATYLFFESNTGFVFMSLDKLFQANEYQSFYVNDYSNKPADNINSTTTNDINADYQTVLQIQYNNGFDFFDRLSTGYYGGEIVSIDGNTGQYVHTRSGKNFDEEHHLNKYTPVPSNSLASTSSYMQYIPYVSQNFTGQNRGIYDSELIYRTGRQTFLSRMSAGRTTIRVYGRCDYYPGMIVYLSIPKDGQITKTTTVVEDQLVSGRYIVSSIKHVVTTSRHTMILDLMKDSYLVDITKSSIEDQTTDNNNQSDGNGKPQQT